MRGPRLRLSRRLKGCDFWGYAQEDQFFGDLRTFLDDTLLEKYDTISPLPAPFYHAGPFMVYRHTQRINQLFQLSSQWRAVVKDPEYMAFVRS